MNNFIVIGGGGHAKVITSILKKSYDVRVIGYTDLEDQGKILGLDYLGNDAVLYETKKKYSDISAAIGFGMLKNSDAVKRKELFDLAKSIGYKLPAIVSSHAIINEDVEIGDGTVVIDGAIVNSGTVIGEGAILNTNCSVDHDCKIGSFSSISPGTVLSGGVTIGNNVLVGTNSTVIQGKLICDNIVIGAGSTVVENCNEKGTYIGSPARLK